MADLVHATAIALRGRAALIRGAPGAGKSDLALRCICLPPSKYLPDTAILLADDQVLVENSDGILIARPPPSIAGKLEIRGMGIRDFPYLSAAPVVLVADLVPRDRIERFPDPPGRIVISGVELQWLAIDPFDASAPLKLLLAISDAG